MSVISVSWIMIALLAQFGAEMTQSADSGIMENPEVLCVALEEGEKPDPIEVVAMAKRFCVAMRRSHRRTDVADLRSYFQSDFLQKNNLAEGDFRFDMLPVQNVRNIQVADDLQTALCYVETNDNKKVVFVLRIVQDRGRLVVLPPNPPLAGDSFAPWLIRMDL